MSARTHKRTTMPLLAALVAATAFVGTAVSGAHGQGVTRAQLEAHGWTCVVPPPFPDRVACFDPGRGRPFPGNPDPAPSYSALSFSGVSGELLYTVHLIRDDLYHGQPCGNESYVFRAPIGYWECEH